MSVTFDNTANTTTGCIGDYCPWRRNQNQNYQYGWVCPKCGRVYSPTTSSCLFCGPGVSYTVTANTANTVNAVNTTSTATVEGTPR